jgi:hypothetical protein
VLTHRLITGRKDNKDGWMLITGRKDNRDGWMLRFKFARP